MTPQVNDLRCFRFQYKHSLGATLGATLEPYLIVNTTLSTEEGVGDIRLSPLARQIAPASQSYWTPTRQSPVWLATQLPVAEVTTVTPCLLEVLLVREGLGRHPVADSGI